MDFSVNSGFLYAVTALVVVFVLAQSAFFLFKAARRARQLGITGQTIRKTVLSSALFSVAPAVAILLGVITLSKFLGLPLPWLRLSVVGSLSYETIAASNAESAMGLTFGQVASLNATQYVTIACVMTVSIMVGIWLVPLIGRKLQNGMISMENRDKKWGEIFSASMFIGMISAFLGYVFCDFSSVFHGDMSGLIPVLVMIVSALVMCLAGLLVKKTQWRWVSDYALPISLVAGMASANPITAWLG